ncbi:hypothetical protein [Pelagibius sp. Alg239-R121]|uniref:hypothetical protein n=1 Tax=Pelagibius sp. Alg239-R121 TaxID=2993448 RepID=UPI0024A69C72|nr:hypothetical protein [Pelagibius sp. Alg239-R121]
MGRGGRFPTVTKAEVQATALKARQAEQAAMFLNNPGPNKATNEKGTRSNPLGSVMCGGLGKQHYDVRYNVHICKSIIEYWGRNAYSSEKHGTIGFKLPDGRDCEVACHIDITTPRDNVLWHGHIEGPHVVVEWYRIADTFGIQRLDDNCFWLSPNDVFMLYIHTRDSAKGDEKPGDSWPAWLIKRFSNLIVLKQQAILNRKNRPEVESDDEEDFFGGLDF